MSGKEKRELLKELKRKIGGALEMPSEIVLNLPLITLIGNDQVNIENFKNIVEYSEERVRIGTSCGELLLCGKKMILKQVTAENIMIKGKLITMEFLP